MKRFVFLLAILVSSAACGQDVQPIIESSEYYLTTFLSTDPQESSSASFDYFLKKLEKKRLSIKKEKDFVRYVFSKTHQSYLKNYTQYASFGQLFTNGSYNCLTGTALYATLLTHFHIPFEVIETNYHIFLTVDTEQGKILLEATDPTDGFVESTFEVEKRIASYKQNTLIASNSKSNYYQFNFNLFKSVSMPELSGLLYYNKAVDFFNHRKLNESIQSLVLANERYQSPRIGEFSIVLLQAIQQSKCTDEAKEKLLNVIYPISQKSAPAVAVLTNN